MNNKEMFRALSDSVQAGDVEKVESLIGESQERLREVTPFGTWLHVAADAGQVKLVEWFLSKGADVNAKGGVSEGAPIDLAAANGHLEVAQTLLAAGAELDVSEPERNPLFSAIYGGHFETVKFLVAQGIDYSVSYTGDSMKNMDAEAFARERGQTEIADYLAKLKK